MTATCIVTLDDVYAEINTTAGADDNELQGFIDAITAVVQNITGPILPTTYNEWHIGGSDTVVLLNRPVISVSAVTEYQGTMSYPLTEQSPDSDVPLDAFGYFVSYPEGTIQRTAYGVPAWFAAVPWWSAQTPSWFIGGAAHAGLGLGRVKVTYQAGFATIPPNVRLGTLELIRINWRPQQGGNLPGMSGGAQDDFEGTVYMGFFVPNRVRELLLPNEQPSQIR